MLHARLWPLQVKFALACKIVTLPVANCSYPRGSGQTQRGRQCVIVRFLRVRSLCYCMLRCAAKCPARRLQAERLLYKFIRPLLFALDPERAHHLTLSTLQMSVAPLSRLLPARVADPVEIMGVSFANRVGLAAGLDKDGRCMQGLQSLGFGFIEIGTVTPLAQPGNPKPRMFRLVPEQSIINRMGFNNDGLDALLPRLLRLKQHPLQVPLGINLGKNKITPAEHALNDYLTGLNAVYPYADYITINLSSPNTPGLRDLQFGEPLNRLLSALSVRREELAARHTVHRPILVKIAPDMARDDLLEVADSLLRFGIDGIIATNTTIDRSAVASSKHAAESGGLSGAVLFDRSTEVVRLLAEHLQGEITIVGVGGIDSADKAIAKLEAGADLLQLYSGLIYQGPGLVGDCARAAAQQR